MAEIDEEEPWEGGGARGAPINKYGQRMLPKATDEYIDTMEQKAFGPEIYSHPAIKELTDNAKDVARQIMRSYNSGDPLTKKMVNEFEKNERAQDKEWQSGQRMNAETAWELFYHAHQKYLGSRLTDEDHPPSPEEERVLESHYGFDMAGRKLFDFQKLIDAGKLEPKGIK